MSSNVLFLVSHRLVKDLRLKLFPFLEGTSSKQSSSCTRWKGYDLKLEQPFLATQRKSKQEGGLHSKQICPNKSKKVLTRIISISKTYTKQIKQQSYKLEMF